MTISKPTMLPPLVQLRVFEAVSRHASIRRAAKELGLDHTSASRHLRALQHSLGSALVISGPSGAVLTDAGSRYAVVIRRALLEIRTASAELSRNEYAGKLSVSSTPCFASSFLIPHLAEFSRLYPQLELNVHSGNVNPEFIPGQAVARITVPYLAENTRQRPLCQLDAFPVASPAWLAKNKRPTTLSDFLSLPLITTEQRCWEIWLAKHGIAEEIKIYGPKLSDARLALEAAKAGQGLAIACELSGEPYIGEGSLQIVDVERPRVQLPSYAMIAHTDMWDDPGISAFYHWLLDAIAARQYNVSSQYATN